MERGNMDETNWNRYKTRVPYPKDKDEHVILRTQKLDPDPRQSGKILLGTDKRLISVWASQLAPIADYFGKNPKATEVKVIWQLQQDGKVIAVVQSL